MIKETQGSSCDIDVSFGYGVERARVEYGIFCHLLVRTWVLLFSR